MKFFNLEITGDKAQFFSLKLPLGPSLWTLNGINSTLQIRLEPRIPILSTDF